MHVAWKAQPPAPLREREREREMEGRLGSSPSHRSSAVVLGTLGVAESMDWCSSHSLHHPLCLLLTHPPHRLGIPRARVSLHTQQRHATAEPRSPFHLCVFLPGDLSSCFPRPSSCSSAAASCVCVFMRSPCSPHPRKREHHTQTHNNIPHTGAANMCDGSPLSDPYDTASPSTLMDPSLE